MSQINVDSTYSLTAPVAMIYPALLEPKPFKSKGVPVPNSEKYGARFLMEPDSTDFLALKSLAIQVAKTKWPGRQLGTLKFPFQKGDTICDELVQKTGSTKLEFMRGFVVLKASSKFQPRLSVLANSGILDLDRPLFISQYKSQFYSGVLVFAQFTLATYESFGGGINAWLNQVLSTGKGTHIGGGSLGSEVFKGVVGSYSAENPLAGANEKPYDSDIPY